MTVLFNSNEVLRPIHRAFESNSESLSGSLAIEINLVEAIAQQFFSHGLSVLAQTGSHLIRNNVVYLGDTWRDFKSDVCDLVNVVRGTLALTLAFFWALGNAENALDFVYARCKQETAPTIELESDTEEEGVEALTGRIAELEAQNKELQECNTRLSANPTQEEHAKLAKRLEGAQARVAEVEGKLSLAEGNAKSYKSTLDKYKADTEKLPKVEEELAALKASVENSTEAELQATVAALETKCQELATALKERTAQYEQMREEKVALQNGKRSYAAAASPGRKDRV